MLCTTRMFNRTSQLLLHAIPVQSERERLAAKLASLRGALDAMRKREGEAQRALEVQRAEHESVGAELAELEDAARRKVLLRLQSLLTPERTGFDDLSPCCRSRAHPMPPIRGSRAAAISQSVARL